MKNINGMLLISILVIVCILTFSLIEVGGINITTNTVVAQKNYNGATEQIERYIYVDGAVTYAGLYRVVKGETFGNLLTRAGYIVGLSALNNYQLSDEIPISIDKIIVAFVVNGKILSPLNVNSRFFDSVATNANISKDIVGKIMAYKVANGDIKSKSQLLELLGEIDYKKCFYMLYVDIL